MIVYAATKSEFRQDVRNNQIADRILESYKRHLGHGTSQSEIDSWKNSMMFMSNALEDEAIPSDTGVAIEYKIPQTAKRIDIILTGINTQNQSTALIVELKQWSEAGLTNKDAIVTTWLGGSKREVNHPSYQAYTYAALLTDFNEAVQKQNIRLKPCAYLHNMQSAKVIKHSKYADYLSKAPVFISSDAQQLTDFIKQYIKVGDKGRVQSLNIKVTDWDQQPFDAENFYIDDIKERPEKIIQSTRLGIPAGRDEHLPYRFIDYDYARFCTSNPLTRRNWTENKHYKIITAPND